MQIHTRKLRNTFSIWQSINSVLTREINHPIQTSLNTESTRIVPTPPPISIISNRYQNDSKKRYTFPFHPLFSPRRRARQTRSACLHVVPLHGRVSRPVYETTSALYPARVQELSCKSISEGCFRAGDSQLVKRLLPTLPILSAGTPRVPRDPVERFKLPG